MQAVLGFCIDARASPVVFIRALLTVSIHAFAMATRPLPPDASEWFESDTYTNAMIVCCALYGRLVPCGEDETLRCVFTSAFFVAANLFLAPLVAAVSDTESAKLIALSCAVTLLCAIIELWRQCNPPPQGARQDDVHRHRLSAPRACTCH
jgi:hypothetical protein